MTCFAVDLREDHKTNVLLVVFTTGGGVHVNMHNFMLVFNLLTLNAGSHLTGSIR